MKLFVDVVLISSVVLALLAGCGWVCWVRSPGESLGGIVGLLAAIELALLWIVFGIVCIVRWIIQAA